MLTGSRINPIAVLSFIQIEGSHCRMRFSRRILSTFIATFFVLMFFQFFGRRARAHANAFGVGATETGVWSESVRELAEKVVALVDSHSNASLAFKNSSSLEAGSVAAIAREFSTELRRQGIRLMNSEPAHAKIQVTLSENVQGFVWVAAVVPMGEGAREPGVAIVAVARPASAQASSRSTSQVILKTKIWEQEEPILDAEFLDTGGDAAPVLLVLDPSKVSMLRMQASSWTPADSAPLSHAQPWPRDPRGRLAVQLGHSFEVYVPGVKCDGTARSTLSVNCHETDQANQGWPLPAPGEGQNEPAVRATFGTGRNFFDGGLTPNAEEGRKVPPFLSAASLPNNGNASWLLAGLDGRARLYDKTSAPLATFEGWGSDLASIKTSCSGGWQVLVSGPHEYTDRDTVRAFEITNREAVAVSPPVEFAGPITALWSGSSGSSATAVSRNLETGHYEAFTLSISCGQ